MTSTGLVEGISFGSVSRRDQAVKDAAGHGVCYTIIPGGYDPATWANHLMQCDRCCSWSRQDEHWTTAEWMRRTLGLETVRTGSDGEICAVRCARYFRPSRPRISCFGAVYAPKKEELCEDCIEAALDADEKARSGKCK